jgi:hypothetical protein
VLKKLVFLSLLSFSVFINTGWAKDSASVDENGVSTTIATFGNVQLKHAFHFTDYALSSSDFVYNEAGGTNTTSGEIDAEQFFTSRFVQVAIPSLAGGTCTVSIEGRHRNQTQFHRYIKEYGTITGSSGADEVNVLEFAPGFKVGTKMSSGTATVSITSLHVSERR